uniref:Uncharacterized protein n=1 Tax=Anopheles merus TaxID=30066 RepID=A0A182VDB6_ANOME
MYRYKTISKLPAAKQTNQQQSGVYQRIIVIIIMIPCALEASADEHRYDRPAPVTAVFMYERLKRMSQQRGLNLSPEDLLASAYLGHNLVYKVQPSPAEREVPTEHLTAERAS